MNSLAAESPSPFAASAIEVRRLSAALRELERASALLQLAPLAGREWYEVLVRKLLPQLAEDPYIVAAVVGGTNIGKSVIFNHLAGVRASATSPLASGTKHPVCLVPRGFAERHKLSQIFQGFDLHPWADSEAALENHAEHRLYWKESDRLPANLLVLDTPDIDSDAQINWHRADCIRHAADVLVAVLTQQKYNDAAVKQFFRNAAAEDKAIIVVFNQCLLPEDEPYWPLWLDTFSRETGVQPDLVYVSPNDRRAAESNRLPFYARPWPLPAGVKELARARAESSAAALTSAGEIQPHELAPDLAGLHFAEIKFRTLRGALRQLAAPETGVPAYLEEIRNASAAFRAAAELLSMQQLARIDNWPVVPPGLLVGEIREWWRSQRQGMTRTFHDFYGMLGNGLAWPVRWARARLSGPAPDEQEAYRREEWDAILHVVNNLYEELERLSQLGNDLLRPRLERLLGGASRTSLLERLARSHAEVRLDDELRRIVERQMQAFREENPRWFELLKRVDSVAAAARPAISLVFLGGGGGAAEALLQSTAPLVVHFVVDIAAGTGAVAVGETALTGTAGSLRQLEVRFRQLQNTFTAARVAWLAEFLRENLLGALQTELQTAAALPECAAFAEVEGSLRRLEAQT